MYIMMAIAHSPKKQKEKVKSIPVSVNKPSLVIIINILFVPQYKTKQHHKLQINLESARDAPETPVRDQDRVLCIQDRDDQISSRVETETETSNTWDETEISKTRDEAETFTNF